MSNPLDIETIAFVWWDYRMSWLELLGTIFGFWAVWLSGKERALSWLIGILNVSLFFLLFYQMQLYSDMFLQIFFFVTNIYGYFLWTTKLDASQSVLPITDSSVRTNLWYAIILIVGTVVGGWIVKHLHQWLPVVFKLPSSFPYADTFVLTGSILAQILLTRKVIENWLLWILVDLVAVVIYFQKGALLLTIEFFLFMLIAIKGYISWREKLRLAPPNLPF